MQKSTEYAQEVGYPKAVLTHLQARYHFYTIGVMKEVLKSSLTKREKNSALKKIFTDVTLRKTLRKEVLKIENKAQKIFFYLLKFKWYCICKILLQYKVNKERS